MIFGVYTIRDEASGAFMSLQTNPTDDVAVRSFDYALQSNDLMRFKPEDFSLWYVAKYDDTTGVITSADPTLIKRGVKRGNKKV